MSENELAYLIRGAIFKVYNVLGPGLLESANEKALVYELNKFNLNVQCQVALPIKYEDIELDSAYRIDIIVDSKVIIEIKSIEEISAIHHKQVLTYLKLSGLKLGLLVNFNTNNILNAMHRKVNGL